MQMQTLCSHPGTFLLFHCIFVASRYVHCATLCPPVHDVPAGQIAIDVSFAGTPIYEEVDDLCSKTSCPIKTGPLDIKYIQDLPPIAPPVSTAVCGAAGVCT